ncbi:hypothetical protein N865_07520 [Intrasporangium oryzae NRRL B-24470]|uniref:Uncharacterized protein n=1 Tax=Intrasporangium oryzae NRRL B-24470 TaxID=1386089 RepID=W9G6Q9_9MICO|nr:hypothetical protein [Intrasporangium oryzae]EWT01705.1 hypothetical protein N865_07520 [Intrasporangium oryzae NRRL B-24470]
MDEEHEQPSDGDLELLRAYEPVLRLTRGEYFVPVAVEGFVRRSTLWLEGPDDRSTVVASPGALTLDALARIGAGRDGPGLSLSDIGDPRSFWERIGSWFRRGRRPRFRAGSRLAQVGLLGRTIDTLSRLSLLVRGAVPGGSANSSLAAQTDHLRPDRATYYGRVLRDGPWIVCQYWFFYAFNNWRSGFSGVNEHEGDWEQVTIYLDGSGPVDPEGLPPPRWVVFSAHDETGDDLRRRWDDPDVTVVNGRHPVVFVGAGSHSGAYLPGDYLITIVPPSWGGIVPGVRRLAKVFTPWSRAAQGSGLGIPYIDYARGDGSSIGPWQERTWSAVHIDEDTPWVRDYRGLWGHDTRDRLGGERGPAGPRYERNATVRMSWGDPVGWAGLAKVAPNPVAEENLIRRRIADIDEQLGQVEAETERAGDSLASRAAGLGAASPAVRALEPDERQRTAARLEAVRLRDERSRLERALRDGLPPSDPHTHLLHRRLPIHASERGRARVLGAWSVISTPLVVFLIAVLFNPDTYQRWAYAVGLIVIVLSVEAFTRGYFLAFIARVMALTLVLNLFDLYLGSWQIVSYWTLVGVAIVILVINLRDALRR